MAEIAGRFFTPGKGVLRATWANLANGDSGSPLDAVTYPDKAVTVRETFGVGGTVVIEGADATGTTYFTLNDTRGVGNALSFTAGGLRQVNENPGKIRPRVTAGDGTTLITVVIECTSAQR